MKMMIKKMAKKMLAWVNYLLAKVYGHRLEEETTESLMRFFNERGYVETPYRKPGRKMKETRKDLSVVIPVYNSEKFLRYGLDAILNQKTKYAYEVVCVNDGSKDSSLNMLREYEARYPDKMVVVDQPNGGPSVARNSGIDCAQGEYIAIVDSDDFVFEGYIEKLMDAARKENADMVQAGYCRVRPDHTVIDRHPNRNMTFDIGEAEKALRYVVGFTWTGVVRKNLYEEVRYAVGSWYEDMMTRNLLMRRAKRICLIEDCLYGYTFNTQSMTSLAWDTHKIKCMDQIFLAKHLQDYGKDELGLKDDALGLSLLLVELTSMAWDRMTWQPEEVKVKAFLLIHNIVKEYTPGIRPLTPVLNDLHKAILDNDYFKWKHLSICRLWK